jgi:hypothetical protein
MEKEKRPLWSSRLYWLVVFALFLSADLLIVFCVHPPKKATMLLQGLIVFVQVLVATAAIWGDTIRAIFSGPKLVLSLDRPEGQLTHLREQPRRFVRYFHLKVENKRAGKAATKTQVILYSILPPHKEGTPKPLAINGRLPFPWKFKGDKSRVCNVEAIVYSVIGPNDYCDLARLIKDDTHLELLAEGWTLIEDFLKLEAGQKTTVEAIAIAENAQSNLLTLDISWDGVWPGETDEHVIEHIKIERSRPLSKRKQKESH